MNGSCRNTIEIKTVELERIVIFLRVCTSIPSISSLIFLYWKWKISLNFCPHFFVQFLLILCENDDVQNITYDNLRERQLYAVIPWLEITEPQVAKLLCRGIFPKKYMYKLLKVLFFSSSIRMEKKLWKKKIMILMECQL